MTTQGVIVLGLMFGDEGKGATVDFLTKELDAPLIVKSSTACQAEHNVVTDDGRHHTFSQFGSGTFQGANTHIASNSFLEPFSFEREAVHLEMLDAFGSQSSAERLTVSPEALVTTPVHRALNRSLAEPGTTTGRGIWQTQVTENKHPEYSIRVKELSDTKLVAEKMQEYAMKMGVASAVAAETGMYEGCFEAIAGVFDAASHFWAVADDEEVITSHEQVIFEQAQGILLDADMMSMHPYVTAKKTTSSATFDLVQDMDVKIDEVMACIRTYTTRHGAGVFPTEQSGLPPAEEKHNRHYKWAGGVRWGWFDAVLANHALDYDENVTALSLGHLDADISGARIPSRTNLEGVMHRDIPTTDPGLMGMLLGCPVKVLGYGPRTSDRKLR